MIIYIWYIYIYDIYIYDIYIYACMKWCSHRYTKLWIHMPASTSKQESSMVYGVARKFFPSGPWRGRRFFISKQSTLDQDRSLPWLPWLPPWNHMKFQKKKKTLKRFEKKKCVIVCDPNSWPVGHLSWLCCPLFFLAASEEQSWLHELHELNWNPKLSVYVNPKSSEFNSLIRTWSRHFRLESCPDVKHVPHFTKGDRSPSTSKIDRCIMFYRCTAKTLLMLAEKLSKPVERSRLWHRSKGGMDLAAPAAALDVEHAQEQAWKII